MKKFFLGISFLTMISTFGIYSCTKSIEKQIISVNNKTVFNEKVTNDLIKEILNQIYSKPDSKLSDGWLRRAWEWVKDHAGASTFYVDGFEVNMGLNLPCGPNPGFCINAGIMDGIVTGESITSNENLALGYSTYGLWLIKNEKTSQETIMLVFNNDFSKFIYQGKIHFQNDVNLSPRLLNIIGKSYAKINAGAYPIVYDPLSDYYYTVVNSSMIE